MTLTELKALCDYSNNSDKFFMTTDPKLARFYGAAQKMIPWLIERVETAEFYIDVLECTWGASPTTHLTFEDLESARDKWHATKEEKSSSPPAGSEDESK